MLIFSSKKGSDLHLKKGHPQNPIASLGADLAFMHLFMKGGLKPLLPAIRKQRGEGGTFGRDHQPPALACPSVHHFSDVYEFLLVVHGPVDLQPGAPHHILTTKSFPIPPARHISYAHREGYVTGWCTECCLSLTLDMDPFCRRGHRVMVEGYVRSRKRVADSTDNWGEKKYIRSRTSITYER